MQLKKKRNAPLEAGLYLIATPIGNLEDITYRAVRVLEECDIVYCEDTRVTKKLFSAYGIDTKLANYHDHNASKVRPIIAKQIEQGLKVGLVSDAGTPLISDPGYKLVRECQEHGLSYTLIPGACAAISGLVLSGMPTDTFFFAGFYDAKKAPGFSDVEGPIIFYESAKRLIKTLQALSKTFSNRSCAVVREISKTFEEARRGEFAEVIEYYTAKPPKGEVVVVLSPPDKVLAEASEEQIEAMLTDAMGKMSLKDATDLVAGNLDVPKKKVYKIALDLKK